MPGHVQQPPDPRVEPPGGPVRVTGTADPVGAVFRARREGREVALATSGTTGLPRWVVRTTHSWWASFPGYSALSGVTSGARLWVPGPFAGTMNLFAAVHAYVVGASLIDAPDSATHAVLTPTALARDLEQLPAGLRVTVAGAALSPALAERARAAGLEVEHYYGAAELSFVARGPDSASLVPFEGVEVQVRDLTIWVRSPYLCSRLEGGPGCYATETGWATVGDLGSFEDSRLELFGRPEAISTGGATVVLAEVERALGGRATCFGLPHEPLGEVLGAAVAHEQDVTELRELAHRRLAPTHRPRVWVVADPLPLTAGGKPDRRLLAERVARDRSSSASRV